MGGSGGGSWASGRELCPLARPAALAHFQSLGPVEKTFPLRVQMRVPSRSKAATWAAGSQRGGN